MIYNQKNITEAINKMNNYGAQRVPFLFIFNYSLTEAFVSTLDEIPSNIKFDFIHKKLNVEESTGRKNSSFSFHVNPVSKEIFKPAFENVLKEINYGNTFLLNLTFPSKIELNYSLEEIFYATNAKYKVYWKDKFVSFSPETFVKIKNNKIFSYPMKGTIDASINRAEELIINNPKEEAEHYTIVDLIRNDLAQVSKNIKVNKFRYSDTIIAQNKSLLQISSEIEGQLEQDWHNNLGTLFFKLLPAGSISGAPKAKTLEIIKQNELDNRGYYTGVAGIYDGMEVDSCVLIRFIEKNSNQYYFRSGGGLTFKSNCEEEYDELIQKIYVPIL